MSHFVDCKVLSYVLNLYTGRALSPHEDMFMLNGEWGNLFRASFQLQQKKKKKKRKGNHLYLYVYTLPMHVVSHRVCMFSLGVYVFREQYYYKHMYSSLFTLLCSLKTVCLLNKSMASCSCGTLLYMTTTLISTLQSLKI